MGIRRWHVHVQNDTPTAMTQTFNSLTKPSTLNLDRITQFGILLDPPHALRAFFRLCMTLMPKVAQARELE